MLLKVVLPALLTLPLYVSSPPGPTCVPEQFSVTTRRGLVASEQVAETTFVTMIAVQASLPRAVTVLLTEQVFEGAVKLAVKLADAPTAKLANVRTVPGEAWLSTTVTLFKETLPALLTMLSMPPKAKAA